MIELLRTFAALALVSGVLMSLLPEGSIKRTAGMAVGLMMLLCWLEGLGGLISLPADAALPPSALTGTGLTLDDAMTDANTRLQDILEAAP